MKKGQQQLMTDSFEIQGIWFLPGKDLETEGIKGTLKYSPGSICLELLDTFEENLILNEDQNNLRPLFYVSCQGEGSVYMNVIELKHTSEFLVLIQNHIL